jgi:hypothetical protein
MKYKHVSFGKTTSGNQVRIEGTIPSTYSNFKIDRPSFLTIPIKNAIPVRVNMAWRPM